MRIEPAVVSDVDRLADAWVDLAREQRSHGTHLRPAGNREGIREDFARRVVVGEVLVARPGDDDPDATDDGDSASSAAADPDAILGFVSFGRDRNTFETDVERGIVHNLYVRPAYRDGGIGAALLSAAERRLAEEGVEVVGLESMADNEAAHRFYRRHGYRPHRVEFEKRVGDQ